MKNVVVSIFQWQTSYQRVCRFVFLKWSIFFDLMDISPKEIIKLAVYKLISGAVVWCDHM